EEVDVEFRSEFAGVAHAVLDRVDPTLFARRAQVPPLGLELVRAGGRQEAVAEDEVVRPAGGLALEEDDLPTPALRAVVALAARVVHRLTKGVGVDLRERSPARPAAVV